MGQELSHNDIAECHTEDSHDGRLFICQDANIFHNDVRKTCLGSLFYGTSEVEEQCQHTVSQTIDEQIWQIAKSEIIVSSATNQTVTERCEKNVSYHQLEAGIHQRKVQPGCEFSTERYTFKAAKVVDIDEPFIRRMVQTKKFDFVKDRDQTDIGEALKTLTSMRKATPVNTSQLQTWLAENDNRSRATYLSWTVSSLAFLAGGSATIAILILYVRYQKSK